MSQVHSTNHLQNIVVRNILKKDIDGVAALSMMCFGPDMSLKQEHFESQLDLFPEGQICVEYNGEIVGTALSLIVNFEDYGEKHTYYEICDLGYIRNHNPSGRNLYGIEVGVKESFRGVHLGSLLYEKRRRLCIERNLESIIIGGRMPFFYKYAAQMGADEYAQQVMKGEIYDPVLTFQRKNGFELKKVIANYLPGDEESLEYAALMEWRNKDYKRK